MTPSDSNKLEALNDKKDEDEAQLDVTLNNSLAATAAEFDVNGIQLHCWSHPLTKTSKCSREACCPCFPLAQVEQRMGIATYASSLAWYLSTIMSMWMSVAACVILVASSLYPSDKDNEDDDELDGFTRSAGSFNATWWVLGPLMFVLCIIQTILYVQRIAATRTFIREQFEIPGSRKEDTRVVWKQTSQVIQQMTRHVQCDNASCCGSVSALQGYVV